MKPSNKFFYFFISMLFFIKFDTYFSNLIIDDLRFKITANPVFDLIFIQNTGAAFNIFEDATVFLVTFSIIAILLIFYFTFKYINKYSLFTLFWLSMLSSGIICNLNERLEYGYVRDYIKLNFVDFPVFNIADIFINISVIAIIILIIKKHRFK